MNRRRFLEISGASAVGAMLPLLAAETPDVKFPTNPRERLAVASYPFRSVLNLKTGTMPLVDFPKMIADRYGVKGIEPLDGHFLSTEAPYLESFRKAVDKAGSRVVNIAVGRLGGSFYNPDAEVRAKVVASAKQWVDVAAAIESPSIRTHITGASTPPNVDLTAESLSRVADYAATRRVVVHLENDAPKTEEAFFLVDVLVKANHPYLRALPDFCNSMLLERGEDYNYKAMAELFKPAYGISHVKDSEQDGKKFFRIDLPKTFGIAKAAGYRGYFSMEFDAEGDPFAPTQALIDASLKALS